MPAEATVPDKGLGAPFWRFWSSVAAVNVADGIRAAALPLIAASISGDAFGVALVVACQQGAWMVFGLVAGLAADRYPPARVVALSDLVRLLMLSVLLVTVSTDTLTIALLAGLAFVLGIAETFRDTAAFSIVPRLVREPQLERANGRLIGTEIVGNEFIGPLVGALLFATAAFLPVAVDATALLVAVILVATLPRPAFSVAARPTGEERPRLRAELLGGVRWLLGNPRLAAVTCSGAAILFADSAWWSVLVIYTDEVLGLPEAGFGVLLACGAVGGTAGALGAARIAARFAASTVLVAGTLLSGLPALVMAVSSSPYLAAVMLGVSSFGFAVWNVVALSTRQREAPRAVLGRVTATHRVVLYGSGMLGALAGGALADALTLTAPFYVAGALVTVAAAGLLTVFLTVGRAKR